MMNYKMWCESCYCYHDEGVACEWVALEREEEDEMTTYFDIPICTQPLSGGSNDYYKVQVGSPTSGGDAYTAECNDIIEALQMTYAEGNAFKALWRHALARRGIGKQGNTQKYEAEKVEFFAKRLVEQAS
jgi:hypothetical protein